MLKQSNINNIGSSNTIDCNNFLLEHGNHVFIFTSSGKPVYTRYGTTHQIADLFALLLVFMNMSQEYDKENKCSNFEASTCHRAENDNESKENRSCCTTSNSVNDKLLKCTSIDINSHTLTLLFYNVQHMYYVLSTSEYSTHTSSTEPCEEMLKKKNNNNCECLHQSRSVENKTCVLSQPQLLLRQLHRFVLSLVPNINDILSSSPSFDVQRLFSTNDERLVESIIASHEGVHGVLSELLLFPQNVFVAESIAIPLAMRKVLEAVTLSSCKEVLRVEKNKETSWLLSLLTPSSSSSSTSSSPLSQRQQQTSMKSSFANGEHHTKNNNDSSWSCENSESSKAANTWEEVGDTPSNFVEEVVNHLFTYVIYGDALLTAVSTSSLSCDVNVVHGVRNERKRSKKNHCNKNNICNGECTYNSNTLFASTHTFCSFSLQNNEPCEKKQESLPCVLSAEDTQLLFHFVRNVAETIVREAWFPLCLPDFNESGFVWIYVANLLDMLTEATNVNTDTDCSVVPSTQSALEKSNVVLTPQAQEINVVVGKVHHDVKKPKYKLLLIQVTASSTSFNCCAYLASRMIGKLVSKGEEWIETFMSTLNYTNENITNTSSKLSISQQEEERSNNININCDCMMSSANELHVAEAKISTVNTSEKNKDIHSSLQREVESTESNAEKDIVNSHDTHHSIYTPISKQCKECFTNNAHFLSRVHKASLMYCAFVTNAHFTINGSTSSLSVPCIISNPVAFNNNNNSGYTNTSPDNCKDWKHIDYLVNDFIKHESDLYSNAFTLIRESLFTYLLYSPTQNLIENLLNSFYTQVDDTSSTAVNNNNADENKNKRKNMSNTNKTLYQELEEHKTYKREFAYLCEKLIQKVFFIFTSYSSQQEMIRYSLECMHHIVVNIDSITVKHFILP